MAEYFEESDRKRAVRRLLNRTWLLLSVCWVVFVIYWIAKEPGLALQMARRPLRTLIATVGVMLAPPAIVYAAGATVWFTMMIARRGITAARRDR